METNGNFDVDRTSQTPKETQEGKPMKNQDAPTREIKVDDAFAAFLAAQKELQQREACSRCDGTGYCDEDGGINYATKVCDQCKGTGDEPA